MSWTDERFERLKELVALGLTASMIAARLGGVTRNSVISKCHRHGLSIGSSNRSSQPRAKRAHKPPRPLRPRISSSVFPEKPEPVACREPDLVIPMAERKTFSDLVEQDCRWPFGDPRATDFHFCGKKKVQGLPYCEFHARRAYQPALALRRRVQESEEIPANSSRVPASKEAIEA